MPTDLPPLSSDPQVLFQHVLELRWRIQALDEWREASDRRLAVLESDVVTEKEARTLREALAQHATAEKTLRLTNAQRLGGAVVGLIALADFIRGVVGG